MEVFRAIRERRSVRDFKEEKIPEKDLKKILDAGRWAPSAGNMQPLEMVLIKDEEKKNELAKASFDQFFIAKAPVIIVICANLPRTTKKYGERGSNLYVIQDTAAAAQNIHLMSHALGYGTCWIGAFKEEDVGNVINAPEKVRPLALIPLGKTAESASTPPKRELEEILHKETY